MEAKGQKKREKNGGSGCGRSCDYWGSTIGVTTKGKPTQGLRKALKNQDRIKNWSSLDHKTT